MQARDFIPGVPAAGHIAANGYWHPGFARNCRKPPCKKKEGNK